MSESYDFLVKQLRKIAHVLIPTQYPKIIYHFICIFHLLVESDIFYSMFHILDNFLPI
jgi:hypothetical protein